MAFEEICVDPKPVAFVETYNGKEYKFSKRRLSWAEMNEFLGKAVTVQQDALTKMPVMKTNKRQYAEDCLVAMLTETPWPIAETRMMLRKIDPLFGTLLEKHVPDLNASPEEDLDFFGQKSVEVPVVAPVSGSTP